MADAPVDILTRLRELRRTVGELNSTMIADLKDFVQPDNSVTFRRLPYSDLPPDDPKEIGVTVTCTVLMALATAGRLTEFYGDPEKGEEEAQKRTKKALDKILSAPWSSSGLDEGNKFTQIMVLRTAGVLANTNVVPMLDMPNMTRDASNARRMLDRKRRKDDYDGKATQLASTEGKTLREIANDILKGTYKDGRATETPVRPAPESITLGKYPASAALVYWFIDAFDLLGEKLKANQWIAFARWTSREFSHQVSLVASSQDAMMDPIALAMTACLASRLRDVAPNARTKKDALKWAEHLPSATELRNGLRLLVGKQHASGIWAKYFPMFQYLDDSGANYCFSFEMLEAILSEFGKDGNEAEDIFSEDVLLGGFEKAVGWIKSNRLFHKFNDTSYFGWNSGGQIQTLSKGVPESWATGVVHMFLFRLETALSMAIKRRLLRKYEAKLPGARRQREGGWKGILDISVQFPGEQTPTTVKKVLEEEIIQRIKDNKRPRRLSALLFGPPGTSKTTLVRELAREIGWQYIEITPSHFLSRGLEQIYVRANEIFDDLLDLSDVVVLFDEMDALVQRRDHGAPKDNPGLVIEQPLDVTRQFLTTSMLPKLAKLHGHKRVLFFMATNHQRDFDSAIKRPGRFDLLLCMGPPTWAEKLANIKLLLPSKLRGNADSRAIAELLKKGVNQEHARAKLDQFTFGEIASFFEHLCRRKDKDPDDLKAVLADTTPDDICGIVEEWAKNFITLSDAPEARSIREEYEHDKKASRRQ